MKYIVMECHLSYAVALDENGRFLYVANRHYEVGQTVTDVIEMQVSQPPDSQQKPKTYYKWMGSFAAMAACFALIVTTFFQHGVSPYGSVYMTINPEVRIDVNRNDVVIDIEGTNEDGKTLVANYSYRKKELDFVMDELVDRAIAMGYLHEGGQITLTLDAEDNEWIVAKSDSLDTHLNEYLTDKLSVTIDVTNKDYGIREITIPIVPESNTSGASDGESDDEETTLVPSTETIRPDKDISNDNNDMDYHDTDYDDADDEPTSDGVTDYDDADDEPASDGVTDYDDADTEPESDGVTDYDDTDTEPASDGVTDYDDTHTEPESDGTTDYGDDNVYDDYDYGEDEENEENENND